MSVNITSLTVEVKSVGIKQASQELGGLSTSAANATRRIENLTIATQKLQAASVASATAAQSLVSKLQQQATLMTSFRTNTAASSASVASLAQATTLLAAALATLNSQQTLADRTQRRHNEGMREAHGLARGLAGSLGALWVTYGSFLSMGVGIAIGASLKAVVTQGIDVEHTLEGIRVRGEESVASIDKMRESLLKLGEGVYGPQQVAKAFETLVMAGLSAEQATSSIGAALNLATVGGTSIEKSASTLVSVGSSIGYAAEGFSRIADVISKTAALSMSSVETLSEAFKSASSVSKLYKVSLEDIATSLGVLSNLGIQGGSAGTALKNMYKELASEAGKVQKTLDKMGLGGAKIKDEKGNFRDLLTVVGELDTGLRSMTEADEKLAIARLSNERGMRLMVQALDLYRKETNNGSNALKDFRVQAENSYGFAAKGAIQMAMTAKSQIESMMNTLKTVFVKTFSEIEPQVIMFSRNMREAFKSAEFKEAILGIAGAFAKMSLAIAENIGMISKVVVAFVAFKAAMMIGGIVTALAGAVTTLTSAIAALRAGSIAAAMTIPGLNVVLGAAALAWGAYEMAKKKATAETESKVAKAYSTDLIEKMKLETEELNKQTDLIKKKMSAQEAAEKVNRDTAADAMVKNYKDAIKVAQDKADKASNRNPAAYAEAMAVVKLNRDAMKTEMERYQLAEKAFIAANKAKDAAIQANMPVSKERNVTNSLTGDPDRATVNDGYAARIATQDAEIRKARRAMSFFEEQENLRVKSAQISKLQMIEEIGKKQVEKYGEIQTAIQAKINAAKGKGDRSEVARYLGEQEQASEDFENKKVLNAAATQLELQKSVEEYTRFRIEQLEKEGAYSTAANLRFQLETKAAFKEAQLAAEKYGDVYPILNQRVEAFKTLQKQAMKDALNKEAVREFTDAADATRNSLKGIQTASEGQGLGAMFEAGIEASRRYQAELPALQAAMKLITNPMDQNEAQAKLTNLAESQRKMWVGIGESIGASLESAFGRGGNAMGELFKVAIDYSNLEKKTGSARIKAYGDAAGAAKGFFKEGTTGYKVMEGAEKAFRALELANMLKSLATSLFVTTTKTGAEVGGQAIVTGATATGEAARNTLKIPGVIMSFLSAMGPYGAVAAAVVIAAVLGKSTGGGVDVKERQRTQGTGSVLGASDAKSESIASSIEQLEKNSGLGLYHSSEMVKSLKSIQSHIGNLASLIVRTTGVGGDVGAEYNMAGSAADFGRKFGGAGAMGKLWSNTLNSVLGGKQTVEDVGFTMSRTTVAAAEAGRANASNYVDTKKDGGAFRSDKYRTNTESLGAEANAQFGKIIGSFADILKDANKTLGINSDLFASELAAFNIDIGKISFKDMTGEEIEKELQAVFSKLGDDMAKWAFAGLEPFQQVGEGMLETVARVTNNMIQVKDVFAVLDKQFYLTGVAAVTVSESMIELAGGIESLTENTKFYVDNFLTEAERLAPITKSVNDRLRELNISEVKTIELFKQKIQSLDLMNAADRQLYVNMIELAPAFKEVADYAQDLADGVVDLTKAQEKALDAVNNARSALQDAYDKESSALQTVIDKTKSFIQTLASYKDSLKLGGDSPLTNVQKYDEAGSQLASTLEKAMGGDQAAKDKFTSAASAFLSASKVVNASGATYLSDFAKVQSMIDKLSANAVNEVDMAQASLDALNRQVTGLLEVNKSVLTVAQAIVNLQAAITAGSATGLTNNQMGVVDVPHTIIGYHEREGEKYYPTMIAAIKENTEAVNAQRAEQKAQVGAQVGAQVESTDRIIDTLATTTVGTTPKVALA